MKEPKPKPMSTDLQKIKTDLMEKLSAIVHAWIELGSEKRDVVSDFNQRLGKLEEDITNVRAATQEGNEMAKCSNCGHKLKGRTRKFKLGTALACPVCRAKYAQARGK